MLSSGVLYSCSSDGCPVLASRATVRSCSDILWCSIEPCWRIGTSVEPQTVSVYYIGLLIGCQLDAIDEFIDLLSNYIRSSPWSLQFGACKGVAHIPTSGSSGIGSGFLLH